MPAFLFDVETNGLLNKLDRIHALVLLDLDSDEVFSCADQPGYIPIRDGVDLLACEDVTLVGHNIIPFDVPAVERLYPTIHIPRVRCFDTLVEARRLWPREVLWDSDAEMLADGMPAALRGSHKLEAWGWRLGVHKDAFGHTADWSQWTPTMQRYCEQDCRANKALFQFIVGAP